ncbi:DUF1206 domain-containing protein [Sphingomonas sp. M1-B02]|uniref:DUF1206 domain-containing protein n=1 Tax=Sphingomonas sp. M1-B02 TaxID=3114300 RepID=UPI00223F0A18|nr:DUF1206 domain-containing protein [Sphingomonas sp. S6-11]UZK65750.1 DUF1206 domain-containing protein [Sphingomonas sp. S6-11]
MWRLAEAVTNPERLDNDAKGLTKRGGMAFSGVAHVLLAWSAVQLALHPRSGGGASPNDAAARDWTGWLLEQPLGWLLVGLVAACFLFGTVQQARKAYKGDFIDDLAGNLPSHVCTMGRIGYGARGVVFAILAGFFAVAAWQTKASEAGAMSDALEALQDQPGGKWLLIAVGIGLALFGAYSFVEARYRRIRVALP